jgi:hypothetical protein
MATKKTLATLRVDDSLRSVSRRIEEEMAVMANQPRNDRAKNTSKKN